MPNTANFGWPTPLGGVPPTVPADMKSLADAIDEDTWALSEQVTAGVHPPHIWIPAGAMTNVSGPAIQVAGGAASWPLRDGVSDQVVTAFRSPWPKLRVSVVWVNLGATSGAVLYREDVDQAPLGSAITPTAGPSVVLTAGAQYALYEHTYTTVKTITGDVVVIRPTRLGSSGSDTLAASIGIVGLKVTRVP